MYITLGLFCLGGVLIGLLLTACTYLTYRECCRTRKWIEVTWENAGQLAETIGFDECGIKYSGSMVAWCLLPEEFGIASGMVMYKVGNTRVKKYSHDEIMRLLKEATFPLKLSLLSLDCSMDEVDSPILFERTPMKGLTPQEMVEFAKMNHVKLRKVDSDIQKQDFTAESLAASETELVAIHAAQMAADKARARADKLAEDLRLVTEQNVTAQKLASRFEKKADAYYEELQRAKVPVVPTVAGLPVFEGMPLGLAKCLDELGPNDKAHFEEIQHELENQNGIDKGTMVRLTRSLLGALRVEDGSDVIMEVRLCKRSFSTVESYAKWLLDGFEWKDQRHLPANSLTVAARADDTAAADLVFLENGITDTLETQTNQPLGEATTLSSLKNADQVLFHAKFMQYDLDASGFLDNSEEIKQLCVNLCFSLKIHRGIEVVLDEAQKIPEGTRFNLQQITAWLLTTFVYEDLREQGGLVQVTGIR